MPKGQLSSSVCYVFEHRFRNKILDISINDTQVVLTGKINFFCQFIMLAKIHCHVLFVVRIVSTELVRKLSIHLFIFVQR